MNNKKEYCECDIPCPSQFHKFCNNYTCRKEIKTIEIDQENSLEKNKILLSLILQIENMTTDYDIFMLIHKSLKDIGERK
jgi:hypothetical protein